MYKSIMPLSIGGKVWSINGTLVLWLNQLPGWIIFFSSSYLWVRFAKLI